MIQNLKICSEIVAQKLMNIIWQCYLKKIPQVGFGAIFGLILGHLGRIFGINLENIILWISQLNNWFWIIVCSAKSPSLASASLRFSGTLFGMLLGKLFLGFFGNSWNGFFGRFFGWYFWIWITVYSANSPLLASASSRFWLKHDSGESRQRKGRRKITHLGFYRPGLKTCNQ